VDSCYADCGNIAEVATERAKWTEWPVAAEPVPDNGDMSGPLKRASVCMSLDRGDGADSL